MATPGSRVGFAHRHTEVVMAVEEIVDLPISKLTMDAGTQMRAELREETVDEYAEVMQAHSGWGPFPAVNVVYGGESYWLTDGFHRVAAARRVAPDAKIPCRVTAGDLDSALEAAAKANNDHGLRRSNADKRRAVMTILGRDKWRGESDPTIAAVCAVTARFVGQVRAEMERSGQLEPALVRRGSDGRQINVANIGRTKGTVAPPPRLPSQAAPEPETPPAITAAAALPPVDQVAQIGQRLSAIGATAAQVVAEALRHAPTFVPADAPVVPASAVEEALDGERDKPGELLPMVLRRAIAGKVYRAVASGTLKPFLTPEENDSLLKSLLKALGEST